MFHDPKYKWRAQYQTDPPRVKLFQIAGVSVDECPVSLITPESRFLVQLDSEASHVKTHSGAALFGSDANQWPADWWDAVVLFESHRIAEHNARTMAQMDR